MAKSKLSIWKKVFFSGVILAVLFGLSAALYLAFVAYRCRDFYGSRNRWSGAPYRTDGEYGFLPNPGQLSHHKIQYGDDVPVLFDSRGFRIPADNSLSQDGRRPLILFLGCSFTHGYGVPQERTFSYLAADKLGGCALNAGVSGWGYAQILLRARKLIPELKPDIVVLQYSPWLVNRAQKVYAPTNWARTPVPYFFERSGRIGIQPPAFVSYNLTPFASLGGESVSFSRFVLNYGLPLYLHDDWHGLATGAKRIMRMLPPPCENRRLIIKEVVDEVGDLCKKNNAKLLVLKLFSNYGDDIDKDDLSAVKCEIVDSYPALVAGISEKTKDVWRREYMIWRGTPVKLVDDHPNEKAHEIIAAEIARKIREMSKEDEGK